MTFVLMVLVYPMTIAKLQKAFEGSQSAAFPLKGWVQFSMIVGAIFQIFVIVVASAYPALLIWFLTRPRARAACLERKPGKPAELAVEPGGTR
jgi:hypothetical protein